MTWLHAHAVTAVSDVSNPLSVKISGGTSFLKRSGTNATGRAFVSIFGLPHGVSIDKVRVTYKVTNSAKISRIQAFVEEDLTSKEVNLTSNTKIPHDEMLSLAQVSGGLTLAVRSDFSSDNDQVDLYGVSVHY